MDGDFDVGATRIGCNFHIDDRGAPKSVVRAGRSILRVSRGGKQKCGDYEAQQTTPNPHGQTPYC